jgi:hypothetical protein
MKYKKMSEESIEDLVNKHEALITKKYQDSGRDVKFTTFGHLAAINAIKEILNQNEMGKSEIARKIVEYFNQDEMCMGKWDSIMYEQKRVVMNLLDQLNQNKDE